MQRHRLRATARDEGVRLDAVVTRTVDGLSRTAACSLIRQGHVWVDQVCIRKPSVRIREAQSIEVEVPPVEPSTLEPESMSLCILYEDDHILVVDKPAGLVVHPAHGHTRGTLVHGLLGRSLAPAPADAPAKPGIVHRLDKDTSGCLIVARTAAARAELERQFREREVGKVYLAVVHGVAPASGTIDSAVGRDSRDRKRMSVRSGRGKPALSRFRRIEALDRTSLLRVEIETGRTHQIRVHLASIGHPVVGDSIYGGRPRSGPEVARAFARQALHAAELRVHHPASGEALSFRAPLPIDLTELIAALRCP